jgi:hypothetical protein
VTDEGCCRRGTRARLARARFCTLGACTVAILLSCSGASAIEETSAGAPLGAGWNQGITPRCEHLYSSEWRPVMALDRQRKRAVPKPPRGSAFADPAYGTCVVRVTDHAADGVGKFARNDYSRRQAFNADDSKMVVATSDGSWHLYDANAPCHLGKLEGLGGDAEPQWHPRDPNLLYYFPPFGIGMQIHQLDVRTGKSRVVGDLARRLTAVWPSARAAWTKSEGSPSADGRYWGFMVDDADWHGLGLVTYDLETDRILATYDLAKNRKARPDHVSMSPSGNNIIVSWDDGPYAFTRDFSSGLKLHAKGEHSDLAVDLSGDDVYVSIDYEGPKGPVFMRNLRTGLRTDLFPTYLEHTATAIHFSGRAFKKPGWVLASTYAESGGPLQWMHAKVFAVELNARPRIVHLAHHHAVHDEYFTEPHAAVNRDFTRVVFNSNWDVRSKTDVDTYLIELPKGLLCSSRK